MKKNKKWILVLIALTLVYVVDVESLKATSLIHPGKFSKSSNSTTSTTTSSESPSSSSSKEPLNNYFKELLDELPNEGVIDVNGTKVTLTGIPQIDYVWDPNLPRELNGFNLSTYPFLDSMPAEEDIGFECGEDKINGFYASIKFGCQLYHHCLYGVRSDFICANFTAFDQKTFICHFASEVDCKNSYKYWSRNDDLYKATTVKSTTTIASVVPLIDRGFYNRTRHSYLNGGQSQQNNNSPTTAAPLQSNTHDNPNKSALSPNGAKNNNRPIGNNDEINQRPLRPLRRPPLYRRRPVDYYYYDDEYTDDFYDERMRRRNRPRNRRPVYDDYDSRRLDGRRPYYDDFDDYEHERRQVRPRNRNEERRRGYEERREGGNERRRPLYDESDKVDERRRNTDKRQQQFSEERKFSTDNDDRRSESRRKNNFEVDDKSVKQEESVNDEKLIKPLGASIFDRARPPPKINRPVPLSEKNKFAYNKNTEKAVQAKEEDSYEYEDETDSSSTTAKISSASTSKPFFPIAGLTTTAKPMVTTQGEAEYYEDEYYDTPTPKNSVVERTSINSREEKIGNSFNSRGRNENYASTTTTTLASSPESFRLNRYKVNSGDIIRDQSLLNADQSTKKPQQSINVSNENSSNKKFANKQTVFDHVTQETPTTHTPELPKQNYFQSRYNNRNLGMKPLQEESSAIVNQQIEEKEQKVLSKIIKRPFLPSRGGNPYKPRGLQPVGVLAQQNDESILPLSEKPKISLEDLYNEEYDVDLNDALNPMLKPLTSSRGILNSNQPAVSVNKDTLRAQSQIVNRHEKNLDSSSKGSTTTEQPEYYDDELEYTYADEVA